MAFSPILILSGCKPSESLLIPEGSTSYSLPASFFVQEKLYSYHAEINAYDRIITGILLVKKVEKDRYKMIFSNESGFQLMALSFENGKMTAHKVFDKLDKKIILNTLEKGMQMLFYNTLCKDIFASDDSDEVTAICFEGKNKYNFKIEDGLVQRIEVFKKDELEKWIEFKAYHNGTPQEIIMKHKDIKLSYHFKLLNNG